MLNMNLTQYYKYEYAKDMLESELRILIKEFERKHGYTPVEHLKSRMKSSESISRKLIKKGYEVTEENAYKYIDDIVGVRIVVSFLSDVYDVVSLIASSTNLLVKERKDYIRSPKSSGYSSYHLKVLVPVYLQDYVEYVPAEIQVRTVAMDMYELNKIMSKYEEDLNEKKDH